MLHDSITPPRPVLLAPARALAALLLAALAAVALPACGGPPVRPPSFAPAISGALASTVSVYAERQPAPQSAARDDSGEPNIGTGFVLDGKGTVVTAAHVIDQCGLVAVRTADGHVVRAKVIGLDPATDIAVLSIPPGLVPAAPIAKSTRMQPGDWVLAVGEPFGLGRSVSAGIVGAIDDHFVEDDDIVFLQSDAAVNPGGSGGPLLDAAGRVIAMNLRTVAGHGVSTGLSLSLPIEFVQRTADEVLGNLSKPHWRLGAEFTDLTPLDALALGLPDAKGIRVTAVPPATVAERLGLRRSDVILKFNGASVDSSGELVRRMTASSGAATLEFSVYRGGRIETLVGSPDAAAARPPRPAASGTPAPPRVGVHGPLSAREAAEATGE